MPAPDPPITSAPSPDIVREVAGGEYVFREGQIGAEMYVLHEGRVEIFQTLAGEERRIAVLEKGDFFGEMSLLEELPRNATARALTDAKLIEINRALFDRMLRDNPEIAVRIMRKLSRRVRETDELLRRAVAGDAASDAEILEESLGEVLEEIEPPARAVPARLVAEDGRVFEVDLARPVGVGRADPVTGIQPEVDLTDLDSDRTSSRRHARLYLEDGAVRLVEEIGTLNGTFVNGERLETAVPRSVADGDRLRFGLVRLALELVEEGAAAEASG